MTILFSGLVCLIGLLTYGFSANPKVQRIGEIAFAMGLLAFLLQLGTAKIPLIG